MIGTEWDYRFLDLARLVSTWSKDPSTRVGAAIIDQNNMIVSVGYNGFPRGMEDSYERLNNRSEKYDRTIHAEMNALLLAERPLAGCRLYTWPFLSCHRCSVMLLQAGIRQFIAPVLSPSLEPRWSESLANSIRYIKELGGSAYMLDIDERKITSDI